MCLNDQIRQPLRNQATLIPAYTSEAILRILIRGTSIAFAILVSVKNGFGECKDYNKKRPCRQSFDEIRGPLNLGKLTRICGKDF